MIVRKLQGINETIAEDTKNLGIGYCLGHSYFCAAVDDSFDRQWFSRIVRFELAPLLEEYWFDAPDKARSHIEALMGGL